MATLRLTASPDFPQGLGVGAYRRELWAGLKPQPGDAPHGPLEATATVDNKGYATFGELEADTAYYFGAQVSGAWVWKSGATQPESAGTGGGGGGATTAQVEAIVNPAVATEAATRSSADAGLAASIAAVAAASGQTEGQVNEQIQAVAPVTAKTFPLGTISAGGTVAVDLRKGRVFTGTAAGAWKLKPPTNPPATPTNEALFVLLKIATSAAPTIEGMEVEGETPVVTAGAYVALLESDDNGTTWVVVGPPAPPANTVRVSSPSEGSAILYESGWKAVVPPWTTPTAVEGLAKTVADARIKATSILTGGHETAATNAPSATTIPVGLSAGVFRWENAPEVIENAAAPHAPNINTTGKTTAQITTAFEAIFTPPKAPRAGNLIVDTVNKLLLYFDGTHWFKNSPMTEVA